MRELRVVCLQVTFCCICKGLQALVLLFPKMSRQFSGTCVQSLLLDEKISVCLIFLLYTSRLIVLKTYVWSTLTYGCECWTITSDIEKKIEAAEMWFIRRMLRISWAEKKTNVNVLREGNVQRSLMKTIRKRQMEFLGHVCRRRGLEFLSLTGKVEGKRDRG